MKTNELIDWLVLFNASYQDITRVFNETSEKEWHKAEQAYQQIKQILQDHSRLTSEPSEEWLEEKAIEWHEEHGLRGYLDIHEKERYMRDIRQFIKDWQGGGK